jgi:6-phosphogluconolactonase
VEKLKTFRITLTFPVLNNAVDVIFLVSGESKAQILSAALRPGDKRYPAQGVQPENGRLLWLADQAAGQLLRSATPHSQ